MKRVTLHVVALVVGILLWAGASVPALAQDAASSWIRLDIVQVLPEKLDDFIELELEEINPAYQRAGVPWRSSWQTAEFGNTYERWFAMPIADISEYDGGGPLARSMQPDALQRLVDRLRRCLVSRESFLVRYRPDLSVESDDVSGLSLARMTTIRVAPGRAGSWEAFLQSNLSQFRGANVVFGVYERVFGPGPLTWQIVENHASFADLEQPGIVARAFGEQAEEVLQQQVAGVVLSVERTVLRYDPELSFSSPASTTQQD